MSASVAPRATSTARPNAPSNAPADPSAPRVGKILIDATRPYAIENKLHSHLVLWSTIAILAFGTLLAARPYFWPIRALIAVINGLVTVRLFIVYHDHMHGALLKNSPVVRPVMALYGMLVLAPPKVWRDTHNYHHAHTAKIIGSNIGSFPMVTTEMWREMTPSQRRLYKIVRHPLTILFGYVPLFMYGMCLASFLRAPRKYPDSLAALVLHFSLVIGVGVVFGAQMALFTVVLPLIVACAAGGYLFYAQHNFPEIYVASRQEWTYTNAALQSSSYMKLGPVMSWFTGNIGYHHVHHLNSSIPFYRLPDAMAAIPELQHPGVTSLSPTDIAKCLSLKLWDPDSKRMVGYPKLT